MTTLGRWLADRKPIFLKWAAVLVAPGAYAVGIYFLWGIARWAAIALGAFAVGLYLLWVAVRKPDVLKWAAVVVALGASAVGIYFLWGIARWAAVAVTPGVCAVGIYWLRGIVRKPDFLRWAAVVIALGVCAVGIYLLWGAWDRKPAAAAFTRVAGATRVETALEASRFWLTPPRLVVETQAHASQQIMLGAARCAMAHDSPLLFTSPDPHLQQLVDATINDWRNVETTHPEWITIQSQRDIRRAIETTLPELIPIQYVPEAITIQNQPEVTQCLGNAAAVDGVSTLEVSNPIIPLPSQVPRRRTLAPVVVFAAAIEPGDPPDVAVGLALAAHMAKANREKVSLVVVPHYLESDLELENALQSQHEQVTGGVVLGETPTVPEDTRLLLRQLLTSTDRQGVAAQVQANLGSVGSLIAALLAFAGAATAAGIAGPIVIEYRKRAEHRRRIEERTPFGPPPPTPSIFKEAKDIVKQAKDKAKQAKGTVMPERKSDWLIDLGDNPKVTVCLRSGRKVTGIIVAQLPEKTRDATAFRIRTESPEASPPGAPPAEPEEKDVLVSVKEIEQIHIIDSGSETPKANRPSG